MRFRFQCSQSCIGTEAHFFIYVLSLASYKLHWLVEKLQEKPYGPQSPKYLLSGSLEKRSANSVLEPPFSLDVFKSKTCSDVLTHSRAIC